MTGKPSGLRNVALAAVLGAIGGGVLVAVATRAVPKIMGQMMAGMIRNMMAQMEQCGLDPGAM